MSRPVKCTNCGLKNTDKGTDDVIFAKSKRFTICSECIIGLFRTIITDLNKMKNKKVI